MCVRGALAVAVITMLSACSSAETSLTSPTTTANRCEVHASTNISTFTANGGNGTVAVDTARDCTWTVGTDASWVTITGARSGQGEASIGYAVASNSAAAPRTGGITVGSDRIQVTQAAAPCRFSLSRSGDTIGFGGGRLTVDVATLAGCSWNASSSSGWVTIASGQSGNASGTVALSVAANSGSSRVAVVNVAGETYTVRQDAAPAPAPAPQPPSPGPTPGPSPSPSPGPAPSPTPPPPAPKPIEVHLDGAVSSLGGSCPNISFVLGGTRVVADGSTDYKKGACRDVSGGRQVSVTGVQSADSVRATTIELQKDK